MVRRRGRLTPRAAATYRDLGNHVQEEGEHRQIDANALSSKPLRQVLGHGDHLQAPRVKDVYFDLIWNCYTLRVEVGRCLPQL